MRANVREITGTDPDARFMRVALREAQRAAGQTSPNPVVGAVVVRGGRIIARGHHRAAGQPHAEVEAIRALRSPAQARGSTLYVTLEPCSTHGRTPPCTDAIRQAGFARVVIGAIDPNPHHAGTAVGILEGSGIAVTTGVLATECAAANRAFNRWIVTGRPWVIAKVALTLDGRLRRAPGEDRWLSGARSLADVHRQRALVDAILVGAGTVRADDPRLTVRDSAGREADRQPWRIVLTRSGDLPPNVHLFTDRWRERTLVFRDQALEAVLDDLGRRQITSVLIEGGGNVLGQAFGAGLVDEFQFYFTPWLAGGAGMAVDGEIGHSIAKSSKWQMSFRRLGEDVVMTGLAAPATQAPG